jgi:hypothetical protein
MKTVTFSRLAAVIFAVAAAVHLYRLIAPFPIVIGSMEVPQVASWVLLVVAGVLGALGFRARG